MRSTCALRLLLVSLVLSGAATAASADTYANDDIAISGAVTAIREDNASLAHACGERQPSAVVAFNAVDYFWEADEFQVIRAANRIAEDMHAPMAANEQRSRADAETRLTAAAAQGGDVA